MIHQIKIYIRGVRPLNYLIQKFYLLMYNINKKDPKALPNKIYKTVFHKDINWSKPIDLIEKIYWLQLYSDTTLWTRCADKFLVRQYVMEKGCGEYLNKLYGKWDNANEIDWDKLPDSFVLKPNHSCGQVIIVKDKSKVNQKKIARQLNYWVDIKYGYQNAQLHYTKIAPCVIAEEFLKNTYNSNKSLIDYKIWCFNGLPEIILVVFNRTPENYLLSVYDLDWNNISEIALNKESVHYSGESLSKPKSLEKMIDVASILSTDFPQVRVDFYDINEKPIFGEMTFTTGYGYFKKSFYDYLGSKLDLSNVKII